MKRLERFEHCHDELKGPIEKVLKRLKEEKREALLQDKSLQIISSDIVQDEIYGFAITFKESAKSIIYINFGRLKNESEDRLIYGIAHEIGHYFAGEGESGLLEKEANDWLKENWKDFDEIIQALGHSAPIDETKGYKIGYDWAFRQDSKKLLERYKLCNEEGPLEHSFTVQEDRMDALMDFQDLTVNDNIINGVQFGIKKRVRELEKEEERKKVIRVKG